MLVVPAGSKYRRLSTRTDAEGRAVVGGCCPVTWEWWRDGGVVMTLLLMMNYELKGRHCYYATTQIMLGGVVDAIINGGGANVATIPICHIRTDHPERNVMTGRRTCSASTRD